MDVRCPAVIIAQDAFPCSRWWNSRFFFDFHSVINREEGVSAQNASLMSRFLDMLENGDYRHNREVMFVQISDMFRFSSPAYFSRYVQRMLGVNPTRYRE